MFLWNGGPYVKRNGKAFPIKGSGQTETGYYFSGKQDKTTFTAWTIKNEGLIYGIIRNRFETNVHIISKCEGIHFFTTMDLSKLVEHEPLNIIKGY